LLSLRYNKAQTHYRAPMTGTFLPDLEVTGVTTGGRAFGMHGEVKVFVEKGVPGDVADVQMVKSFPRDKSLATGKILTLKKNSPLRVEAFCRHFIHCGGCQWQNISYENQLRFKQQQVEKLFERLSETEFEMLPILPSPQHKHFRNRVTFTFSNRRWMSPEELRDATVSRQPAGGFVLKGNNDRIMNIEECFLADEFAVTVMKSLRAYALGAGIPFYDARHEKGFLRSLTIRLGDNRGAMAIVGFGTDEQEKVEQVMTHLANSFPQLTSLYYVIRPWKDGLRSGETHHHFSGEKYIEYRMDQLMFRTGPASFYQTNSLQAVELYKCARTFADLTGEEVVYDLYTGTGTIALFIAHLAKKVVGIDNASQSIEDAKSNAALNRICNTFFLAGDLKDALSESVFEQYGKADVIITDPPRAGMHDDVIRQVLASGAKRIVYISCNPQSQVRDIRNLSSLYKIVKSQPVDMFPQSSHVENITLLERKIR
jgi:23S rRNA (uracil1939-C5)-methyltransferase